MTRHLNPKLRRRPIRWAVIAGTALGSAAIVLVVGGTLEPAELACAAYVGTSVGITVAASQRGRDLRKSAAPLFAIPFALLFLADAAVATALAGIVPAKYGMAALYLSFWMSLGVVVGRIAEREARKRRGAGGATLEIFTTVLGTLGGIAIPLAGLASVTNTHSESSSLYLTDCNGVDVPANGGAFTVAFDKGDPEAVSFQSGTARYQAPEYYGEVTFRVDAFDQMHTPTQAIVYVPQGLFLQLAGRVLSMGALPRTGALFMCMRRLAVDRHRRRGGRVASPYMIPPVLVRS